MYVEIEMGGKTRKLRYDFNAIADIEEKADLGIGALFSERRAGLHSIRMLVWGGLKWQDKGLTVERAGTLIRDYLNDGGTFEGLMEKVQEGLSKSGIVKIEEVEEEGNPEAETE